MKNKKAQVGASLSFLILGIMFLLIGLFVFAVIMPVSLPFINMIIGYDDVDPLTKFLFGLIPFITFVGVVLLALKN